LNRGVEHEIVNFAINTRRCLGKTHRGIRKRFAEKEKASECSKYYFQDYLRDSPRRRRRIPNGVANIRFLRSAAEELSFSLRIARAILVEIDAAISARGIPLIPRDEILLDFNRKGYSRVSRERERNKNSPSRN